MGIYYRIGYTDRWAILIPQSTYEAMEIYVSYTLDIPIDVLY